MKLKALPCLVAALMIAAPASAQLIPVVRDCAPGFVRNPTKVWSDRPTAVIDGDSFCMGDVEIRMRRFNAPEWDERGGPEAREKLRKLLSGKGKITCEGFGRSGDRVIASCKLRDGRSIDQLMKER